MNVLKKYNSYFFVLLLTYELIQHFGMLQDLILSALPWKEGPGSTRPLSALIVTQVFVPHSWQSIKYEIKFSSFIRI